MIQSRRISKLVNVHAGNHLQAFSFNNYKGEYSIYIYCVWTCGSQYRSIAVVPAITFHFPAKSV